MSFEGCVYIDLHAKQHAYTQVWNKLLSGMRVTVSASILHSLKKNRHLLAQDRKLHKT